MRRVVRGYRLLRDCLDGRLGALLSGRWPTAQQSRFGPLDSRPRCIFMHHQTWGECPQSPRFCRDERCDGQGLVRTAACAGGSAATLAPSRSTPSSTAGNFMTGSPGPAWKPSRSIRRRGGARRPPPGNQDHRTRTACCVPRDRLLAHQHKALETACPDVALHRLAWHREAAGRTTGTAGRDRRRHVDQFARRVKDARDGDFPALAHRRQATIPPRGWDGASPRVRWRPALRSPFIPLRAFAR